MKKKSVICIIFYLVFLFVLFLGVLLPRNLNNLDEIWNFNFARNVANGLLPYNDFNMLQTPLFSFIFGGILKVFKTELIVVRIFGAIMGVAIIYLSYKILKKLKLNTVCSILSSLFLFLFLSNNYYIDYNYLCLFITLIIIFLELDSKKTIKYNILIGFIAGISILLKQSTGIVISGVTVLYILINNWHKDTFKLVLYRIIGVLIPIIVLLLYLIITNSLVSFFDYCILGINTFSNKISYINLLYTTPIFCILVPIYILYFIIWGIKNKDQTSIVLGVFSLANFVCVYPIADEIHFQIAAFPAVLGILYFIFKNIQFNFLKPFLLIGTTLLICGLTLYSIDKLYQYKNANKSSLTNFSFIPIDINLQNRINVVDEFIIEQEKPVYILDATAAIYMIPLNRYNKDYDMFLNGNLGSMGENGQIEKIEDKKNCIFLLRNDTTKLNWQTPTNVINYVKTNLTKVGTISIFDIYEK